MADFEILEPMAQRLDLEPEVLGSILMLMDNLPLSNDIYLDDDTLDKVRRLDAGEDVEDTEKIFTSVLGFSIYRYFQDVAADPDKYLPAVREKLEALTADRQDGEDLRACVDRNLHRYTLEISITPIEPTVSLLEDDFLPLLYNPIVGDVLRVTKDKFTVDEYTRTATYVSPETGSIYSVKNIDTITGDLSTPSKKILYAALLYLTDTNYHRAPVQRATVVIPLIEYGLSIGRDLRKKQLHSTTEQQKENRRWRDRIKDFRQVLRRDLEDLKQVQYNREDTRGDNAGGGSGASIISKYEVGPDFIRINFDVDFARDMNYSKISWFPPVLLKTDNHNPNAFPIGCKIAFHRSIDNNVMSGTDCTLRVKTLLKEAPGIMSLKELEAKGRTDWQAQIKDRLEKALNNLVSIGYLKRWNYRDPNADVIKTLTPEEAADLDPQAYLVLDVDFDIRPENIRQQEHIEQKKQAKAVAPVELETAQN